MTNRVGLVGFAEVCCVLCCFIVATRSLVFALVVLVVLKQVFRSLSIKFFLLFTVAFGRRVTGATKTGTTKGHLNRAPDLLVTSCRMAYIVHLTSPIQYE